MSKLLQALLQALTRGLTSAKTAKSTKGALIVGGVVAAASLTSAYLDSQVTTMPPQDVASVVSGCQAMGMEPVYHLKSDGFSVISVNCVNSTDKSPRTIIETNVVESAVGGIVDYLSQADTQD